MSDQKNERKKYCKGCKVIKPITDYYRGGTNSYQSRCKPCHKKYTNDRRLDHIRFVDECRVKLGLPSRAEIKKNKRNKFKQLPEDKKEYVKTYLGTMPLAKIARHIGINTYTMHSWKRRGYIVFD